MNRRFAGREDSCTEFEARDESDRNLGLSPELKGLYETLDWHWRSRLLLMVVVVDTTEHPLTKPAFIMNY